MRIAIKLTAMKNQLLFAALCAAFLVPTRSDAEITIEAFYDPLDSHGDWIEVGDYGYCWQPESVGADWRPYTVGEWVYTDVGWTWDSDEPFGWATYHYGNWVRLSRHGWVWVPGVDWAPAWVSWRHSDRYTGWAPLPPESRVHVGVSFGGGGAIGVSLGGWVDSYYDMGPSHYSFVETRYLGAPRLASVIVPPRQNITIINETRNVTNITVVNKTIINNGPDYNFVAQRAERPIRKLRLAREEVTSVNALTKAKIEGDTIKIGTPRLAAQPGAKPRKVARKVERAEIDNGWQNAGSAAEVEKVRGKLRAEAKVPENLPSKEIARERVRTAARGDKAPKGDAATAKTETGAPGAETATAPGEPAVSPTTDPAKAREETPGKERKAGEKKQVETPPTADSPRRPRNQPDPLPKREPQADKPESPETSPTAQPKERNRDAAKPQSDASQAEKRQEKAKRNRAETDQTPPADQPKERSPETAKPQSDAAQAERRQEKAKRDRAQAEQAASAAVAARQREQAERVKAQERSVEKPAVKPSKPNKPESPQPPAAQPERAKPADNPPQAKVRTDRPRQVQREQRRNERRTAAAPQQQVQQQPKQQPPKLNAAAKPNRPAQVSPAPRQGQPQAAKKEGKKKGGKAESEES